MDARGTVENDERHNRGASAAAAADRAAIERGPQGVTTLRVRRATFAARLLIFALLPRAAAYPGSFCGPLVRHLASSALAGAYELVRQTD